MDQRLLEILACPVCKGKLTVSEEENELICRFDKLAYPIRENIPVMLADEARHLKGDEV
ncbi:Trm112 family protein [Candidiatus Paracoxiella cheracis]|uniref:Trm112 family protein n=1 Tax=Candidiatus Paracoxiella cheracis TaxID=3405120 RepID=UPI003BF606AC